MGSSFDAVAQANALRDEVIARRRDFHEHPELGFEEVRTAGIVAAELSSLGMEVQTGVGKTGVIGILEGAHDGPTVLVRADMDALPIHEENQLPFASRTAGKMHACGHDGHTAIALAVAKILSAQREQMRGRVKFVFQPAEEIAKGAVAMITDGALENPRPVVSLGLHLWNNLPVGTIGMAEGPVMAGASTFEITLTGRGGHAASPHMAIDPVVCAAHLITAFQTIVSRNVDPFDGAVITVGRIVAGDTHNVIPQTASLKGTVRFFRTEVRDMIVHRMHEVLDGVCAAMNCSGEMKFDHSTLPVANHPEIAALLRERFTQIPGVNHLDTTVRTMGAEDMGYFMTDVPGMYFFVGARDNTQDAYYPHHHPRFSIDEESLPLGVALLASAVAHYVLPEG
jgi:amidohydrolase